MTVFKTLQEAETTLAAYIPAVREVTGRDITLQRIRPLMQVIGNPQDKIQIIHVAGTSGKTSTAYYLASLLQSGGKRVGLTVSPHIDTVTERVQINLQPLDEAEFCRALGGFIDLILDFTPQPSYFELLIAFAYWYFAEQKVDYAVVETGLGGMHDGSNVAQRADKVCVITDIGYDHVHILGRTLPEIAAQKAGIIHAGNQAFMYRQSAEITDVFMARAKEQKAHLTLYNQPALTNSLGLPELARLPLYQRRNWLLARAVSEYIAQRDSWQLSHRRIIDSLLVQIPGRMDEKLVAGKTIIMDGAHNEQKMQAFVRSFQQKYPASQAAILLSLKQGKEYKAVLPLLKPICSRLIITTFNVLQDLPSQSIDPNLLAAEAERFGLPAAKVIEDPREAYQALLASTEEILAITGSFYLLSCVRPLIMDS